MRRVTSPARRRIWLLWRPGAPNSRDPVAWDSRRGFGGVPSLAGLQVVSAPYMIVKLLASMHSSCHCPTGAAPGILGVLQSARRTSAVSETKVLFPSWPAVEPPRIQCRSTNSVHRAPFGEILISNSMSFQAALQGFAAEALHGAGTFCLGTNVDRQQSQGWK